MKQIIFPLSLLAASLSAAPDFNELLSESTDMSFVVSNIAQLNEKLEGHPLDTFLSDEDLEKILAHFGVQVDAAEQPGFLDVAQSRFNLSEADLLELFPGQFSISIDSLIAMMDGGMDRPDLLVMAETSADVDRMQSLMQIQFDHNAAMQKEANQLVEHRMIERSFLGETLYLDETFNGEETYIEDAYALVGDVFILASPVARLEAAVEAIKEGNSEPMSRGAGYLRASELSEAVDVRFMMNLSEIIRPLKAKLSEIPNASGAMAMMGMTPDSIWNALGLDALQTFWVDLTVIEDGIELSSGLTYSEKVGILSLLTYKEGPLPEGRYVPADAIMASIARFNLSDFFANFEAMLIQASPNLGQMFNLQLLNLQGRTGVDLRAGILNNFGDNNVAFTVVGDSPVAKQALLDSASVYVFDVRDSSLMGQAIDGLLAMSPQMKSMLKEETFAGETIYVLEGMPNPNLPETTTVFSYVMTRSQMIACTGPTSALKSVLTQMQSPQAGFWEREDIQDLVDRLELPQSVGTVAYDFSGIDGLIVAYLDLIRSSFPNQQGKVADLDLALELPFLAAYGMEESEDLLFTRALLIQKEDQ